MELNDVFLTQEDVIEWLHISKRNQQRLRSEGKIPFIKLGSMVRYNKSDLMEWIKKHRII